MRKLAIVLFGASAALAVVAGPAWAGGGNPAGTGQPSQSCEDAGTRPGQASSAPGSAFNEDGTAGSHYAGEQPQNSVNPHSISQYDVACVKQP